MNEYKIHARGWIERHAQDISDWHQIIWRLAEPAWRCLLYTSPSPRDAS